VLAGCQTPRSTPHCQGHPRIGGQIDNRRRDREKARVQNATRQVRTGLADKTGPYEDKFGYVYLVWRRRRSAERCLTTCEGWTTDAETERRVVRIELMKITGNAENGCPKRRAMTRSAPLFSTRPAACPPQA